MINIIRPELSIDTELLRIQIKEVLNSNIPENTKSGLHRLLGTILDEVEK